MFEMLSLLFAAALASQGVPGSLFTPPTGTFSATAVSLSIESNKGSPLPLS